jgi:adenylate kinase family enzyme
LPHAPGSLGYRRFSDCSPDAIELTRTGAAMRIIVFGNSGSGKSTLARRLAEQHGLTHLDLDSIVWEPGKIAVKRSSAQILASLDSFLAIHQRWVIEGCYGELVQAASEHCTEMLFLNPGLEACLANNLRRPWEPEKYASRQEQDSMLANLQEWVAGYYERQDDWSLQSHRRIFDDFDGAKSELVDAADSDGLTNDATPKSGR